MTKKSILRDQFSWKVRTFAQNLCENGLHLGKERAREASLILRDDEPLKIRDHVKDTEAESMLSAFLSSLSSSLPRPLVLIIDEIDALVGDSLVSVLRQIRAGYANRPAAFPCQHYPLWRPRRS